MRILRAVRPRHSSRRAVITSSTRARLSSPRLSRASLQHVVADLRAFLRFLASAGEAPTGLDTQIDTPRVYRGEQLPRALPWDTVRVPSRRPSGLVRIDRRGGTPAEGAPRSTTSSVERQPERSRVSCVDGMRSRPARHCTSSSVSVTTSWHVRRP